MDELSRASRNVSILLNRRLDIPPIPIKKVRKNGNNITSPINNEIYQAVQKINKVKVFEIWKVFLEENEDDLYEIFVIISANAIVDGYKKIDWEKICYEGFYTTIEEAQNQIVSYT